MALLTDKHVASYWIESGLTPCDKAGKTMNDVTETATQIVDTAKAKAFEMLDEVSEKRILKTNISGL